MGAERRDKSAQTRERGPPSEPVEFFNLFLGVNLQGSNIREEGNNSGEDKTGRAESDVQIQERYFDMEVCLGIMSWKECQKALKDCKACIVINDDGWKDARHG